MTTAVVSFGPGTVLGLSKAQAASRSHALTPVKDREGWFETTTHVQFKRGEELLYAGNLPKAMADLLTSPEKAKAKSAAKPKKAADPDGEE
ncbi:MAG TPA: hypothetical protein VGE12_18675 [Noviherbaspirillum sp.]